MLRRLVYIEWDDAETHAGWIDEEDAKAFGKASHIVRQCGFIVEETDRYLVLAGSWCPETPWHNEKLGDVTRIPKTWIRKKRTLMTVK